MPTPLSLAASAARRAMIAATSLVVRGADDAQLERRFGSAPAQRVLMAAMTRSFRPEAAEGFTGTIVYELTRPETGGEAAHWTIEVAAERARVVESPPAAPALTMIVRVSDFVRIVTGRIDPAEPMLHNRATFKGDFGLAARVPEMFGTPQLD